MARNRFVTPDVVRVPLSDGEWIDIKQELNAGEERQVISSQVKEMRAGQAATLDPAMVGKAQMLAYLLAWSLTDGNGKPVAYAPAVLDGLDVETFTEIRKAIEAHDEAVEARRAERKKTHDGTDSSPATLPSVV